MVPVAIITTMIITITVAVTGADIIVPESSTSTATVVDTIESVAEATTPSTVDGTINPILILLWIP